MHWLPSRTASPVRDAYCDGATTKPHWSSQSLPGRRRAMMSHLLSSVTDSVDPWRGASGTSGSFSAAASDSSYCGGAQMRTANSVSYLSSYVRSPPTSLCALTCRQGVASERAYQLLDRPCHRLDYFTNFSSCLQLQCNCYPLVN